MSKRPEFDPADPNPLHFRRWRPTPPGGWKGWLFAAVVIAVILLVF